MSHFIIYMERNVTEAVLYVTLILPYNKQRTVRMTNEAKLTFT